MAKRGRSKRRSAARADTVRDLVHSLIIEVPDGSFTVEFRELDLTQGLDLIESDGVDEEERTALIMRTLLRECVLNPEAIPFRYMREVLSALADFFGLASTDSSPTLGAPNGQATSTDAESPSPTATASAS